MDMSSWFSETEVSYLKSIVLQTNKLNGSVIEIGTFKGQSAVSIISALPEHDKLICVDPFTDFSMGTSGIQASGEYICSAFKSNMEELGLSNRYVLHRVPSNTFFKQIVHTYPYYQTGRIRFALIDGAHEYPYVADDIRNVYNNLVMGGVMVLDDTNFPQVGAAINDTIKKYAIPYSVMPGTKLGVAQKIGWLI
jgi:hypothetical protein